jgi:uncharacterized phage protein (TIGR02216 family)
MQRFPWGEVMRLGIITLHLSPRDFWSSTLRELVPPRSNEGLPRGQLAELMQQWPDEGKHMEQIK